MFCIRGDALRNSILWKQTFIVLASASSVALLTSASVFAQSAASVVQSEIAAQGYYSAPPPAGFNPLTAPNTELQQYGFPSRPTSPGSLAIWTKMMAHAKTYVPPDPTAGSSFSSASSGGWAGYVNQSPNNGSVYFNGTWASWTVPTVSGLSEWPSSEYKDAPQVGIWTGLGGSPTDPTGYVLQAGTTSIATSTPEYRFWTEDVPNAPVYEGPVIRPGDTAYVTISFIGPGTDYSNNEAVFFLEDYTTDQYTSIEVAAPYLSEWSADYVVEPAGNPKTLPNFTSTSFSGCGLEYDTASNPADGNNTDANFDQLNYTQMNNALMTTGAVNTGTDGFTVTGP